MKKLVMFAALCTLTSTPILANDSSWWRDVEDYYIIRVNSTDSDFQAIMQRRAINSDSPYVGIQLVIPHERFCTNKDDKFVDNLAMTVNDQNVAFEMSCHDNKWLNIFPASLAANDYVLKEFNSYGNKAVTFVLPHKDAPDWVFNFPTKSFAGYYSSLDKSIKEVIQ